MVKNSNIKIYHPFQIIINSGIPLQIFCDMSVKHPRMLRCFYW